MNRLVKSFGYAFKGLASATISEPNLRIHLLAAVLVTAAGFYFHVSLYEWIALVLCFGMVITAELFNTAIEKLTDLASPDYHPAAGKVKDIAAGAVLVSALVSLVVGLCIFVPKWCSFL